MISMLPPYGRKEYSAKKDWDKARRQGFHMIKSLYKIHIILVTSYILRSKGVL